MSLGSEYRKLWTASAVSNLGDGVTFVAAPLLAATLTGDPALVAGLSFAYTLPRILFALVSGALADRLDRRLSMGVVNAFRATVMGALGLAVLAGWASLPLLYLAFLLLGASETLFDTSASAMLPSVVQKDHLPRANGRLFTAQLVADEFLGPPLGGLLFATAAALPFLLDAGSFAAAAAFILAMRGRFLAEKAEDTPDTTLVAEIGEGLRWLLRHRLMRALAAMTGVASVGYMTVFSVLVLYAQHVLGLDEAGYGLLLAFSAVGGLAGTVMAGPMVRRLGPGRTIFCSLMLGALSFAGMAGSANPYAVGVLLAAYIFHAVVWNVVAVSLRQELVPGRLLGRVGGAARLLGLVGLALGALLGGLLARAFGLTAPLWAGALLFGALAFLALPAVNNGTIAQAREHAD